MNSPQETLELQCKQSKSVAVTTMGLRNSDVNNFIVVSEEGPIYSATIRDIEMFLYESLKKINS